MVYDPTTTTALEFINLQQNLIISYMKSVIEFVAVDGLEYLCVERNSWICLINRAGGVAEVHFKW